MMQHRLMPRWRSDAEGVVMGSTIAIRLQAGETDEDQFLRGEGALDLLIEIEAIVVTPA
jgi:hypothetical protein